MLHQRHDQYKDVLAFRHNHVVNLVRHLELLDKLDQMICISENTNMCDGIGGVCIIYYNWNHKYY